DLARRKILMPSLYICLWAGSLMGSLWEGEIPCGKNWERVGKLAGYLRRAFPPKPPAAQKTGIPWYIPSPRPSGKISQLKAALSPFVEKHPSQILPQFFFAYGPKAYGHFLFLTEVFAASR